MSRFIQSLAFVARFVVVGLAIAFVVSLWWPGAGHTLRTRLGLHSPASPATSVQSISTSTPAQPSSYALAVRRAVPSVVNIYANRLVTEQPTLPSPLGNLLGNIPVGPAYTHQEQSLGSGVIINSSGYVLTNNHVVAHAQDIRVMLHDGRVAAAHVVGTDPLTDLAVLKVDAGHLPAIHLATSSPAVGDVVLAIGNPLGIGQTVTMGIVSATRRQLGPDNPETFIQTDAAINFGNSGGALVNTAGQLVGINTALLGHGTEGISFAIPTVTARNVMRQIIAHGHVTRSWLGLRCERIPGSMAQPGAKTPGVLVTNVYAGGPAQAAGIHPGDVLLQLDGNAIVDPVTLFRHVANLPPGTRVTLTGTRSGQRFQTTLVLSERPVVSASAHRGNG